MILKSQRYGSPDSPELPYRIDLLRTSGWDLRWPARNLEGTWARLAGWTEPRAVPWTQAFLARSDRRDAAATLAMFESEAHGLALWRLVSRQRRPPLLVVSCWLANLAREGGRRRELYRRLYQAVDAIVVFSSNQVATLVDLLGVPKERIHVVRFGIDLDELVGLPTEESGTVAAIGRDLGRDWPTLAAAADGTGWNVDLMTRRQQIAGIELPLEVRFHDPSSRPSYLEILARSSVVALPSEIREYPTGQTVLLEAMALGKACVVTDTPAMREYVTHGVDGVLVPPGDVVAFRDAVDQLLVDVDRRHAIGSAARFTSDKSGGAAAMWRGISRVLQGLASA